MVRIGILGIDDLTETFLAELFRLYPHAHVFLSAGDAESANLLARKFPCWIQDNWQAVADEADIILVTWDITRSDSIQKIIEYRQTQLVLLLHVSPLFDNHNPSPKQEQKINAMNQYVVLHNLSPGFPLTEEQVDNYLCVLRVQLMSMRLIHPDGRC